MGPSVSLSPGYARQRWGGLRGQARGRGQLFLFPSPAPSTLEPAYPSLSGMLTPCFHAACSGFSKRLCTHRCLPQPHPGRRLVMTSHLTDEKMEGPGSWQSRSESPGLGCRALSTLPFVRPHLPLLWGQRGGSPGARQQVRAEQAREIPGVTFASVNFKQLLIQASKIFPV